LLEHLNNAVDHSVVEENMPSRSSPRKRALVNYNEDKISATEVPATKISGSVKKAGSKLKQTVSKSLASKRKAEEDEQEPDEKPAVAQPAPAAKKRKTKGSSGSDDAMPLAERTAVSTLGKAMYIGAHVSAAGGLP
jgi:AP endonuclease 1